MLYVEKTNNCTIEQEMMKSINQEVNELSKIYYSNSNINLLQKIIKMRVEKNSGYKIDNQSKDHLIIVMRSMYTLHANAFNSNIKDEIKKLNEYVIVKCTQVIITNILMYFQYVNDASSLPIPLEHSEFSSKKGSDVNEFKSFF